MKREPKPTPFELLENDEAVVCPRCGGSGFFADCWDDLCHGREECIHGDDATCRECDGEGEILRVGGAK